ncbi:MAG: phosphatase domain-containing protein, partial [Cyclobacteriaceae bacterium]
RGFGNQQRVIVAGHVFKKYNIRELNPLHSRYHNLRQTLRRFRMRPLAHTKLHLHVNSLRRIVPSDKNGFFASAFKVDKKEPGWHNYQVEDHNGILYEAEYFIPSETETGVISDIDDTLLVSHATRFMRKIMLLLFRNAYSRKTVPQVLKWYNLLRQMNHNIIPEDFFYVSNSEWNLHDFLTDFFDINGLPKGVFMLRGLKKGLRDLIKSGKHDSGHKHTMIRFLLDFYPNKPFILVGDSGQKDIEIYSEICAFFPKRIKAVLIRKISYKKNDARLENFVKELAVLDIPFAEFQ